METKTFEVRDRATFIPMLAIEVSGADGYLARSAGYGDALILMGRLSGGQFSYDPFYWPDRTFYNAHRYIQENWETLKDGDVIDVRFILKETDALCESEQKLHGGGLYDK